MPFEFEYRADHFLLDKVRGLCQRRGMAFDCFLEDAVKEAIAEVRTRQILHNGRKRLQLRPVKFRTDDPEIERIDNFRDTIGVFGSIYFEHLINRKIERKLVICEMQALQSRS